MGKVRQLEEAVFKKIAAGEVVERPLSVVKELVENALDSQADSISVILSEAGKTLIRICDNGEGFDPEDIEQAFKRHSTSKFRQLSDFNTLDTLGFRGEALPSILEVSMIELKSSNNDEGRGQHVIFDGSAIRSREEIAFNRGSELIVKDLFYNFPVRKKFLKTERTELNQIIGFIEQAAIVNPGVTFSLINNNKVVFTYNKTSSLKERIYQVFGSDFSKKLVEVNYSKGDYHLFGYISDINTGGATKKKQFFFVNQRVVREKTMIASFNNSFRKYLEKGRSPEGVLLLTVPSNAVDVNIHPMKLEIKFLDTSFIYNIIKNGIDSAFQMDSTQTMPDQVPGYSGLRAELPKMGSQQRWETDFSDSSPDSRARVEKTQQPSLFSNQDIETDDFRLIGQYQESYILIEKGGELVLVDQHNGHERANFDKLKASYLENRIETSTPLFPLIIELSHSEMALLDDEKMALLEKSGFELRSFSGNAFDIKTYPSILSERDVKDTVFKIIHLDKGDAEVTDKIFAEIACKSAIKINHSLQAEEMKIIVRNLFNSSNPHFCPHGRPIIIRYSLEEIEKLLKRR